MFRRRLLFILLLATISGTVFAQRQSIVPRPLAPVPYRVRMAVTAFAGDRFLTVWPQQADQLTTHLIGAFSDADGKRISPASFAIVTDVNVAEWLAVQLVSMGSSYALFWRDHGAVRHMVEIDLDGVVTRRIIVPYSGNAQETYAWNGRHFLAVVKPQFVRVPRTDGVLFDRDGTLVRQVALERINDDRTAIPSRDGFIVFTGGRGGVIAQRVDETGASQRVGFVSTFGTNVAAAEAGDGDALAVWAGPNGNIQAARVTADLEIGTRHQMSVPEAAGFPLHVTRSGDGFRVVARFARASKNLLYVFHLGPDGALRDIFESAEIPQQTRTSPFGVASNDRVTLVATGGCDFCTEVAPVRTIAVRERGEFATEIVSVAPLRQSDPLAVAANGRFLVTWLDSFAGGTAARAAAVTPQGQTVRATTVAANVAPIADRLAWNDNQLALLVTRQGGRLLGSRITADGTPLDREPFTIGTFDEVDWYSSQRASVVPSGEGWIVGWVDRNDLFTAEVSIVGAVGQPRRFHVPLAVEPPARNMVDTATLATNGREVLVLWENRAGFECLGICGFPTAVYVTRLNEEGQSLDVPVRTDFADFIYDDVSIASGGDEFLIVLNSRLVVARTAGGALHLDGSRPLFPFNAASDVVWDGDQYVVALRYGVFEEHVALLRFDRNGLLTANPRYTNVNGSDVPYSRSRPSVAADRVIGAAVAVHEGLGAADTAQVTLIPERELAPLPPLPAAPRGAYVEEMADGHHKVSWEPQPGVEGYVIEQRTSNGWSLIQWVSAGETSAIVSYRTAPFRLRAFNAAGYSAPAEAVDPPGRRRSASAGR